MGKGTAVLAGLRVLAVLVAGAGIGLGAWGTYLTNIFQAQMKKRLTVGYIALTIVHDVDSRGISVLNSLSLEAEKDMLWRRFFNAAVNSQTRIWIAIGAVR